MLAEPPNCGPAPFPNPTEPTSFPSSQAEPVVAERQLQNAVAGGAADVGAVGGRGQHDERHPPARGDQQRGAAGQQLPDPLAEPGRPRHQVGEREDRQHQERLEHLGQETQPEQRSGQGEPPGLARLEGPGGGVSGDHHDQHQQRVGVVVPEHQRGDRGEGHDGAGDDGGRCPEPAAHGGVEHADRGHAFQGLRHQQAPVVEAEDADRQLHHPERGGGLVDGDEVGGVERAEQERLPARGAGLDRGRVKVVGPAIAAQAGQVQQRGRRQQGEQRGPGPRRVGGPPPQQPGRPAALRPAVLVADGLGPG